MDEVEAVVFLSLAIVIGVAFWTGYRDRPAPMPRAFRAPRPVSATREPWEPDEEPEPLTEADLPPNPPLIDRVVAAMRHPNPEGPVDILNGCPRCQGRVVLRRRDRARYCKACDRTFYPLSDDSVILPPDKAA